ncbi:DEAD/DEAH box helicase family protein [Bremerella sp.]|uniref:DEAD/DEAH box helicase family protein n=1 Tax=Bremerella sp. TaxID=2795602 RepID=UPI003918CB57
MKTINFEFLKPRWEALANIAGFAEQYVHADPSSALVKLRQLCEQVVEQIYAYHRLSKPYQPSLNDLLQDYSFRQAVPSVVVSKLHSLRVQGNKAAHGETVGTQQSRWILHEAFDISKWLVLTYSGANVASLPTFQEPEPPSTRDPAELRREKKAILERLAKQEAQTDKLLQELEAERKKLKKAEATAEELQAIITAGQQSANTLEFNEATTRQRLIDSELVSAGWNVGANGASNDEVGQEIKVAYVGDNAGEGRADYVLYRRQDGRALAVIEAKKTSVDPEVGREQARKYAEGIAATQGGHRPIIFCTNGFEITIWNDANDEPPRQVFGFYSKDSLEYLLIQNQERWPAEKIVVDTDITNRMYQIEAIKRTTERFAARHRQALIVQATGTGKTRVSIALCNAMIKAGWARRVLFLCDRRELRKQAKENFQQHLDEPLTYVTANTYKEREHRIYLATYPAMMKVYESFDVGFFDLVICDESHRSIYNRYRDLLLYFDAYQVGLTATPVKFIARNTYSLFGCEDKDPTSHYSYSDALTDVNGPFLVNFKVKTLTTDFTRRGIKYSQLSEEQQRQLEDDEADPEAIDYESHELDKKVFNLPTIRIILENLMTNGIKDPTGSHVGKTIVFARNHNHAIVLQKEFRKLYPQYGGNFCKVVDNYEPRAEDLMEEFKKPESGFNIAISVDMLDTGVDVPEVVNLVFAKPVYSYVKFWQMIGRGTRLCKGLFGVDDSGNPIDKSEFLIFDHWGNFEYFDELGEEAEPRPSKSLLQRLFEARLELADIALNKPDLKSFDIAAELLSKDIADLPDDTISVKEKYKEVQTARNVELVKQFAPATVAMLRQEIAPLMQWRSIEGDTDAYKFDLLMSRLEAERLRDTPRFEDFKADFLNQLTQLSMHLNQVRAKETVIAKVRGAAFWEEVTVADLEEVRRELRGIMKYRAASTVTVLPPKVLNVTDDKGLIEEQDYKPKLDGLDLVQYRRRVESVLRKLFDQNDVLQRIKAGEEVSEDDLQALVSLVLTQEPDLNLSDLVQYYPETAGHLDLAIRSIIGLDPEAVKQRFNAFVQKHTTMNSMQLRFMQMLQNHIAKYGSIEIERLYEEPFTSLSADGVDGIFADEQIDDLLEIIGAFRPVQEDNT